MIFAVLKFHFASNTSVLNLLVFNFIFAVLYWKFDKKNFIRRQVLNCFKLISFYFLNFESNCLLINDFIN